MDRALSYSRLVPATLLPPEDPAAIRRTMRDWYVDVFAVVVAVGFGWLLLALASADPSQHLTRGDLALDQLVGGTACLALALRRRAPVVIAVLTTVLSVVSVIAAVASAVALFTVAVHRRTALALAMGAINVGTGELFTLVRPSGTAWWVDLLINAVAVTIVVAWGMFVRARRQLVWTLRERAERAESEQRMLADQARAAERTRIAREMHDVLAHRISLLALHAGGLQVRPDLPADEVRETATLLRATAQQALEELRGVIGVLREDADGVHPAPPQPTLRDLPRLVDDTRRTGAKIDFEMIVPEAVPDTLGRDVYRIVQEALTNVAKHARGTATRVRISGAPGDGLRVDVRNRLPLAAGSSLPGSGTGLLGLQERVTLTGGTLTHGPDGQGEFVVDARLAWR